MCNFNKKTVTYTMVLNKCEVLYGKLVNITGKYLRNILKTHYYLK